MTNISFSIEERNNSIANILQLRKIVTQLADDIEDATNDEHLQAHLTKEYNKAIDELKELEEKYTAGLPRKTLSRCPFSNETYSLSIDTFGLDGVWWDAVQPVRAYEEESQTFFALTGSVTIIGKTPNLPFPIKPGPAVPWVSPRLLADENITAVLSHVKIGIYDAYVVVYFSKDKTTEIERINTWGTGMYIAEDSEGLAVMGSTFDDEDEYDFDIATWIKKGKLKWIALKDESFVLQNTVDNCPYIDVPGERYPVLIHKGIKTNCMIILEYEDDEQEESHSKFCTNCGASVSNDAKFCGKCGNKLSTI